MNNSSDVRSNAYCDSVPRSRQGANGMSYSDVTIMDGIRNDQAVEIGQTLAVPSYDNTASVCSNFCPPYTQHVTPRYRPYRDASPEHRQPIEFSSNGYSHIGSQFDLNTAQGLERNLLADPVLVPHISTDVQHNPNAIVTSQTNFEDQILPFYPNLSAGRAMHPFVLNAKACGNGPGCDASIPIMNTDRAVITTNSTTSRASVANSFSTCTTTTPSNPSPSDLSVKTTHLDALSKLSTPYQTASSKATGTHTSPHHAIASLGHPGNLALPSSTDMAEELSSPIFTPHRLGRETSTSLASRKTSTPNQPQAITYHEQNAPPDAIPLKPLSSKPSASVTRAKAKHGYSKRSRKGCSAIRRGKSHKANMRDHERMTHEEPPHRPSVSSVGKTTSIMALSKIICGDRNATSGF